MNSVRRNRSFNWQKLIGATIAGAVTMWLLAGLWHIVLVPNFYRVNVQADHEGKGVIIIAYILLGLMMAFMYSKVVVKKNYLLQGLLFGGFVGILWVFPNTLVDAGAHGEPVMYVVQNALWHVVEQGAGGLVIALIYHIKKDKKSNETRENN